MTNGQRKNKTNKMTKLAALVAIAFLLTFISIPIIPIAPWLKIDVSDVPILIGAFAFGPLTGVFLELFKCIISLFLGSGSGGFVGELANFLMGTALILPASYIYHKNKSKKTAVFGMFVGIICMVIVGVLSNVYILLPLYGMKMTGAKLQEYIVIGLIPFNLVKGVLASGLTYCLYKKLAYALFKVDHKFSKKPKFKENLVN